VDVPVVLVPPPSDDVDDDDKGAGDSRLAKIWK
jgi:hypothetical protein